jgi:hypothetical protein
MSGPARAFAVAAAGIGLFVASDAAADEPAVMRVGVVDVIHVNIEKERAESMADALGVALESELMVEVVAGAEARSQLGETDIPDDCVAQAACLAELARALSVDQLLALVIVRGGDRIRVQATWWGAEADELSVREPISFAETSDDVRAHFAAAAGELVVGAAQRPAPSPAPKPDPAPELQSDGDPAVGHKEAGVSPLDPARSEPERHMTAAHWAAGGLGAATLATGLGIGTSLAITCRGFGACEMSDSRSRWRARADLLAVSGGLVLGATLTHYAFFSGPGRDARGSEARIGVAPSARGFEVFGRF